MFEFGIAALVTSEWQISIQEYTEVHPFIVQASEIPHCLFSFQCMPLNAAWETNISEHFIAHGFYPRYIP